MDKKAIRKRNLEKRDNVPLEKRIFRDQIISEIVMEQMGTVSCIGIYVSMNGEVDTYNLIQNWLLSGVKVCVPRVEGGAMNFYEIKHLSNLEKGTMGILEPNSECEQIKPEDMDQLYIPMIAFNDALYRIGYGAGYYDRYLVGYNGVKIGLAYASQRVEETFQESHDMPCDIIVTDSGIFNHII